MTAVLVHGNPETDAVWSPLVAELARTDVVRLSLPAGAPRYRQVEEYRRWLVGELEAIGEPIDLVGHDWGGHAVNVATTRPDLLRSWVSDLLSTTAGDLELRIPKLRTGSFFPSLLKRRRRVDQALFAVVMEAYLHGVSARKVDDLASPPNRPVRG
jgi:pimeloyl-ACP methyl ester carboxylesterase